MKEWKILVIVLACISVFFLVYSPHFDYNFPSHVDEWHYIEEGKKINSGEYNVDGNSFRIGFILLLAFLDRIFDIVLIYKWLPAIWAVITSLVLFFLVYKKSNKNFTIALFALLFFASLKSNTNLGGSWFFIPSVFCIPFIYLFMYFFDSGLINKNKNHILISFCFMLFVLFAHSASFLFAIPILIVFSLFNLNYIKKEWKFFSLFALIPIIGAIFYLFVIKTSLNLSLASAFDMMKSSLVFVKGRFPSELNNSFLEVYSFAGYLLALLGIISIFARESTVRKYLIYLLWPLITLLSIFIFKIFGVSFFAPYQRTMYYFAISLPFLSAFGLYSLLDIGENLFNRFYQGKYKKIIRRIISLLIVLMLFSLVFISYNNIPGNLKPYKLIDEKDYQLLSFLKNQSFGRVLSSEEIGSTVYSLSGKTSVNSVYFYGKWFKQRTNAFFNASSCKEKNGVLWELNATYVILDSRNESINCGWKLIYNNSDYIYNVRNIFR